MTKTFSFLIGIATGAILTLLVLILIAFLFAFLSKGSPQFVTVNYQGEAIELHTYMPQDSVKILMGEPDRKTITTIGRNLKETWSFRGDSLTLLIDLEFDEGKLVSINTL